MGNITIFWAYLFVIENSSNTFTDYFSILERTLCTFKTPPKSIAHGDLDRPFAGQHGKWSAEKKGGDLRGYRGGQKIIVYI